MSYMDGDVCAKCKHFTNKDYPEHRARGEGRCTGYDGSMAELKNPFIKWDHRVCVLFGRAVPMGPRNRWIEKQQGEPKNDKAETKTKGRNERLP